MEKNCRFTSNLAKHIEKPANISLLIMISNDLSVLAHLSLESVLHKIIVFTETIVYEFKDLILKQRL
jgi:hypothetical protein